MSFKIYLLVHTSNRYFWVYISTIHLQRFYKVALGTCCLLTCWLTFCMKRSSWRSRMVELIFLVYISWCEDGIKLVQMMNWVTSHTVVCNIVAVLLFTIGHYINHWTLSISNVVCLLKLSLLIFIAYGSAYGSAVCTVSLIDKKISLFLYGRVY